MLDLKNDGCAPGWGVVSTSQGNVSQTSTLSALFLILVVSCLIQLAEFNRVQHCPHL